MLVTKVISFNITVLCYNEAIFTYFSYVV